ncbi:MAG TPA: NUDIX domain-containing protein [Candidatus Paceibacterota bacterium]|nr:NUDIX domain-containing protein [Verrucomicrobiota bacterium]HOX03357.1 NUDIX domain-containing protein [Verrucomicrobiota bacterium]HRZ46277.1 NUDIX domain-containing protein [Candidatus Paceibacterota bacterium]
MYRICQGRLEVFLAHPGGPFFRHRNSDTWSIPKGGVEPEESLLEAAIREFQEEVGIVPHGPFIPLGWIRQKGGKIVHAWAFEGECDAPKAFKSMRFQIEIPPGSGRYRSYPEMDRASFFTIPQAKLLLKVTQHPYLDRLEEHLRGTGAIGASAGSVEKAV